MRVIDRDPTPDPSGSPAPFDPVDSWRLIRMRWLAGLAMLIGTVGAAVFDQALPTIQLIALSLAVLGYNAAMAYAMPRAGSKRLPLIVNGQIIFDWIALASFVHLTGGIESPAIFFFLFHLILVAMVFSAAITYRYAAVAIGVVIAIAGLEAIGWLPHYPVLIPPPSELYRTPTYILAIVGFFSVTVGVVVFLATRLMRELRDRERRLTALTHTLQVMPSSLDLPHVLNQIVVSVTHALEVKAASIRLLDQTGEQLTIAAAYGLSQAISGERPGHAGQQPDRSGGAARPTRHHRQDLARAALYLPGAHPGRRHSLDDVRPADRAARSAGRLARVRLAARLVRREGRRVCDDGGAAGRAGDRECHGLWRTAPRRRNQIAVRAHGDPRTALAGGRRAEFAAHRHARSGGRPERHAARYSAAACPIGWMC